MDVVIVTWNHGRCLDECVQSLSRLDPSGQSIAQVVVVDNASRPPAAIESPHDFPVAFIRNRINLGFAAACNQGASRGHAEYLLFLNPDTWLQPGSLTHALRAFQSADDAPIGLVGLRLTDHDGITQRTSGRFATLSTIANQTLGLTRLAPDRFRGIRLVEWPHETTSEVDFVCGAALLVRRKVFEELGGFDERLFLYLEDMDLAWRARHRGWRARFCADAVVGHHGGWASGRARSWRLAHSWRSLLVYSWTHLPRVQAVGVTLVVIAMAPMARIGEACADRSLKILGDTIRAWLTLCALLANDARRVLSDAWRPGPAAAQSRREA